METNHAIPQDVRIIDRILDLERRNLELEKRLNELIAQKQIGKEDLKYDPDKISPLSPAVD